MDTQVYSSTNQFEWDEPDINEPLDALINFLNERDSWQNPTTYSIEEMFTSNNKTRLNKYELTNLTFEKDSECIVGHDIEGRLPDIDKVLTMIQIDDIAYISMKFESIQSFIQIALRDGYIKIYC